MNNGNAGIQGTRIIDEQTEKAMLELNANSKRQRVDHKKEYYVKECGRLENECAQLKKELSEIKGRRKTSIWQRMWDHQKEGDEGMKVKKGDYLVIETTCNSETKIDDAEVSKQPFTLIETAQTNIKAQALDCVDSSSLELKDGKDKNWGSNFFIVQVVKIVRPVPVATIKMELMEVK